MSAESIISEVYERKVVVIVRRIYGDTLKSLAKALFDGGIRMMEVTFDQGDNDCIAKTGQSIAMLKALFKDEMRFGAGTVLTVEQVAAAQKAGGEFIISPNTNMEVIAETKRRGLVSIPGAMTPTEVISAHQNGADFVKLFPASVLGLDYFKSLIAPIDNVDFMATGGITKDNFADYLDAGYSSAGVGGYLANRKLAEDGDFAELTRRAKEFCAIAASHGRK